MEEQARLRDELRRRNRRRIVIIALIAAVLLGGLAFAGWYVYDDLLGDLGWNSGYHAPDYVPNLEDEAPDPNFEALNDITDAASLNEFMREWWHSGDGTIRYSKDVVNVLLIGEDDNEDGGVARSDTMMLCSVNKKTRMITLISFLRDSYAYLKIGENEYYHRLNSALPYGGPAAVMDNISHLFKIRVDKYATVDFRSFPKIIDALGGVVVDVEEKEARYINRTAPSMRGEFPFGERVRLGGKQALVYSRIRKLDSDVERTQRQQKIIESLIKGAKGAGPRQLYRFLDQLAPYIVTNYTKAQLVGMVPQALGWMNYGTAKASFPILEGEATNAVTGALRGMFLVVTDYPLAAYQLQMALYGESNINLEQDAARDEYIQSLFRSLQGRPQYTQPQAPSPDNPAEQSNSSGLDFKWPWQRPHQTPTEPQTAPPTQPPVWEPPAEETPQGNQEETPVDWNEIINSLQ